MKKDKIENEWEIKLFLESLKNQKITPEEELQFKKDFVEVVFKPKSVKKKNEFCKVMDMDFFKIVLSDLGLPYKIRRVSGTASYHVIEDKKARKTKNDR